MFRAAPILTADEKHSGAEASGGLRFRVSREGDRFSGEPELFCRDMWWRGYGKIAVVPTVHPEYSDGQAKRIKELKGYASKLVEQEDKEYRIQWRKEPPENIWCAHGWGKQFWVPWDQAQASR